MSERRHHPIRLALHQLAACAAGLAAFAVATLPGNAQAPIAPNAPSATGGVITGRAVDGVTRAPVAGTSVGLSRNPQDGVRSPSRSVVTDAQGRFAFTGLPEGRYALTATRPGWTMGIYQVEEPRQPEETLPYNLVLQNGQRVSVSVPVWRDAVLSGRVTSESGDPIGNARVNALQWTVFMGRRRLSGRLALTDDRGAFSIRVPPGQYFLSAGSDDGRARNVATTPGERFALVTTFFPSSPDVTGASAITVKSGEDRSGLDIRLPIVAARRVTGTLRSADGAIIPNRISITSEDENGLQRATAVGPDGRFAFDNIPPDRYVIATPTSGVVVLTGRGNPGVADAWARASVDVERTDIDVAVDVHRSLRISGRVQFDGSAPASTSASITLTRDTEPAGSDVIPPAFPVGSDGQFSITVTPGRYILSAGGTIPSLPVGPTRDSSGLRPNVSTQSWTLRSAMSGGHDIADTALVVTHDVSDVLVTLSDRSAELRGRVLNVERIDEVQVLLFPADQTLWTDYGIGRRQRLTRPAADGSFTLARLPAGNYYICAVRGARQSDWRMGVLFDVLEPIATRVSLDEGAVTNLDLRVANAPAPRGAHLKPPTLTLAASDVAEVRPVAARPSSGGSIAGRVVDAATQAPIAGMKLSLSANLDPAVYSDDTGRFLLTDVPPGQHTIYTLKASYVPTIYGARRPDEPGTPVSVAAGQQVTDLTFPIMRGASITGTVLDQWGLPMSDVEVGVRQYRWQPQGRELVAVRSIGRLGPAVTDTEGAFRIYNLAPGDYVLDARARSTGGSSPVTLTTQADLDAAAGKSSGSLAPLTAMYPAISYPTPIDMARGARLRLSVGEERTVSLQMELVPIAKVTGMVRGPDGQPLPRIGVQLMNSEPASAAGTVPARVASSDETGQFTITGVLPGRYTLVTRPLPIANQPSANLSGAVEVAVNGDVERVVLDLSPAQSLTGRLRTRGGTTPQLANVRLQASRLGGSIGAGGQAPTTAWDSDGRFTFSNLLPGRYRLTLAGPRNTVMPAIVSQTVNGQETLSSGIEVASGATASVDLIVASGPSQLSGRVRTGSGQPARDLFLILFAREAEAWASPAVRIFATQPDQNSQFIFRDVPPGNYWIGPMRDVEPNGWFNPELLKTLAAGAQEVSVVDGNSPELMVTVP